MSVRLANASEVDTDSYEYDAYGNHWSVSGSTPNNMLYKGEEYDSNLGLYYLRARYYNPATGRFMSRDPLDGQLTDPKSLHKYLYADGDPVNGVDPMGREDLFAYDVQLKKILKAAPTLTEWGIKLVDCVLALAAQLEANLIGDHPAVQKAATADYVVQCGLFFFDSFRLIYAAAP